jgi:cysteine-rich secretory family protein
MSLGRFVCGALLLALPLACGERAGDPVVALADDQSLAGGPSSGDSGGRASSGDSAGPVGLCGACISSNECGDANDACIHRQGESFCGRDCDDQRGCPDGYECVALNDDRLRQCVPRLGCPEPAAEAPSLVEVRRYLLSLINAERAKHDKPALDSSECLDELAQQSSLDFARTDEPLGKYVKDCDPIWPDCGCGWTAEAEVSVSGYALDWSSAVDRVLADPDERVARAFMADDFTAVGIGFWLSGDEAWIALSFG